MGNDLIIEKWFDNDLSAAPPSAAALDDDGDFIQFVYVP